MNVFEFYFSIFSLREIEKSIVERDIISIFTVSTFPPLLFASDYCGKHRVVIR